MSGICIDGRLEYSRIIFVEDTLDRSVICRVDLDARTASEHDYVDPLGRGRRLLVAQ
jgi:hypothetical protein